MTQCKSERLLLLYIKVQLYYFNAEMSPKCLKKKLNRHDMLQKCLRSQVQYPCGRLISKQGENRKPALWGVIKKKGSFVCVMMTGRDKPGFNNLSCKAPRPPPTHKPTLNRQTKRLRPRTKQHMRGTSFSRFRP